jgi:hypothetical protein
MLIATAALCLAADTFAATWMAAQLEKWKISPGERAKR